jgi:hypothetical protein
MYLGAWHLGPHRGTADGVVPVICGGTDSRPNADSACPCKDACGRFAAVLDVEVYLKGFSYQQQIAGYE